MVNIAFFEIEGAHPFRWDLELFPAGFTHPETFHGELPFFFRVRIEDFIAVGAKVFDKLFYGYYWHTCLLIYIFYLLFCALFEVILSPILLLKLSAKMLALYSSQTIRGSLVA